MSDLSQSPQVHHYRHPEVITSFNPHYSVQKSHQSRNAGVLYQPVGESMPKYHPELAHNRYKESQIQQVFSPIASRHPKAQVQVNKPASSYQPTPSQINTHRDSEVVVTHKAVYESRANHDFPKEEQKVKTRYQNYPDNRIRPYKYNLFSVMDEPWNRWRNGHTCDNLASNECIAKNDTKQYDYVKQK